MSVKIFDTMTTATPNFPLAYAEKINIVKEDGSEADIQTLYNNGELSGGGDSSVTLTQEEFDALDEQTKLENDYRCYDTGRLYYKGVRYGHDEPETIKGFSKFKEMKEQGLIDDEEEYLVEADENGILLEASDIGYSNAVSNLPCTTVQGAIDKVAEKVDGLISDTDLTSTTSTLSASKIKNAVSYSFDTQSGNVKYVKFKLSITTISVVDIYGGKIEILGANKAAANPDYKTVKVVRLSYGDWGSYDATQVPSAVHTKIGELYYYPTDEYYYLKLYNYSAFTMTGLVAAPEILTSLPVEESAMTLIPESLFVTKSDLAAQTANRQVKTFDNTSSTTEKWYKICSALTGGVGCNIKLTASRADSTATVQYFSVLFRDNRYRYTSSYISRERTVYESMLIAEYSAYIIADANNDIWVHVPSYGKAIIEIDTRAITIDGTAGTPVEDYVYSSFEHQYDGKIDDASTNTTSTWSSSKIASEINPTIDISKVFLNGTLNIATLCSTYGNGRYVAVGQGTTGNGTVTIDIWTLVGGAISYIVNALYSPKTSTMFVGYTYENPTIDFDANYFTHCNHIAKVCTLA